MEISCYAADDRSRKTLFSVHRNDVNTPGDREVVGPGTLSGNCRLLILLQNGRVLLLTPFVHNMGATDNQWIKWPNSFAVFIGIRQFV